MGFRVWGLGFRVQGLGFRVRGLNSLKRGYVGVDIGEYYRGYRGGCYQDLRLQLILKCLRRLPELGFRVLGRYTFGLGVQGQYYIR